MAQPGRAGYRQSWDSPRVLRWPLCITWNVSISSPRFPDPPWRHWGLDDVCFSFYLFIFLMYVFILATLLEDKICLKTCVTVFSRIGNFSESTCSACPQHLMFGFLSLQLPLYHAFTGSKGPPPSQPDLRQGPQEWSLLMHFFRSLRMWTLYLSQRFFHLNMCIHFFLLLLFLPKRIS